jgi:hypothetical protein
LEGRDFVLIDNDKEILDLLPRDLLNKAFSLGGEYAWEPVDSIEVAHALAKRGIAIVGVELWNEQDGNPLWIATSNYECPASGEWAEYVAICRDGALNFIKRFQAEPNAVFNFTLKEKRK